MSKYLSILRPCGLNIERVISCSTDILIPTGQSCSDWILVESKLKNNRASYSPVETRFWQTVS